MPYAAPQAKSAMIAESGELKIIVPHSPMLMKTATGLELTARLCPDGLWMRGRDATR